MKPIPSLSENHEVLLNSQRVRLQRGAAAATDLAITATVVLQSPTPAPAASYGLIYRADVYLDARTNCCTQPRSFLPFTHHPLTPMNSSCKPSKQHQNMPLDHQAYITHGWTPKVGQKCRQTGTLSNTAILECENPFYHPIRKG